MKVDEAEMMRIKGSFIDSIFCSCWMAIYGVVEFGIPRIGRIVMANNEDQAVSVPLMRWNRPSGEAISKKPYCVDERVKLLRVHWALDRTTLPLMMEGRLYVDTYSTPARQVSLCQSPISVGDSYSNLRTRFYMRYGTRRAVEAVLKNIVFELADALKGVPWDSWRDL
jgi:hypothetical protein